MVGYGVSIFLITIGAILKFAIKATNLPGVDLEAMGVILMVVGGATFLLQLVTELRRGKEGAGDREHSFGEGPPSV
jgi:hypothetical protein